MLFRLCLLLGVLTTPLSASTESAGDGIQGPAPHFGFAPTGMAYDAVGDIYGFPTLYVVDELNGQAHLYRASDLTQLATITGPAGEGYTGIAAGASSLYWLANGILYESEFNSGSLVEIGPVALPLGGTPGDLTVGPDGDLWVTDSQFGAYSKHSPVDGSYSGETIFSPSGTGGVGTSLTFLSGCAAFLIPNGSAVDGRVTDLTYVDVDGTVLFEFSIASYGDFLRGLVATESSPVTGSPSVFLVDAATLSIYEVALGSCPADDCHLGSPDRIVELASESESTPFLASPALPITDVSPIAQGTLTVSGLTNPVRDVQCRVAIEHTFIGDLVVTLSSPSSGVTVTLHDSLGAGSDDLIATFSDRGRANGQPYNAGDEIRASGPGCLADFDGLDPNGDWTLTVHDQFLGETGLLEEWELSFDDGRTIPDADATGLVSTFAVVAPAGDLVGDVDLELSVEHPDVSDLTLELTSPEGTVVLLASGQFSGSSLEGRFDDDPGAGGFNDGFGSLVPSGSLADFDGEDPTGTWTLTVVDASPGDVGALRFATLRICPSECAAPVGLTPTSDCSAGEVTLNWTNPTSYDAIEILRDGVLVAELPGTAITYVESVSAGQYEYEVAGVCGGARRSAAATVVHAPYGDEANLLYIGEFGGGAVDSGSAIWSELEALGETVLLVDDLESACLPTSGTGLRVWLALGTFPDNRALTESQGQRLTDWQATGASIYIEGGDVWGFDLPTPFAETDGVEGQTAEDGDDSFVSMTGLLAGDLDLSDLAAAYIQDQPLGNDFTDRVLPTGATIGFLPDSYGTDAHSTWTAGDYFTGNYYQPDNGTIGRVIAQSWEFGGFGGDPADLIARYVEALTATIELFQRGDVNNDALVDVADPVNLLAFLFTGGPDPACFKAADANASGLADISDAVFLLSFLFVAGPPPPDPFPDCGAAEDGGDLTCLDSTCL